MQFNYYELLADACRKDYWTFIKTFWHTVSKEKLVANWHMPYLANEIQDNVMRVYRREKRQKDLVVNISPGTSKSSLFSIFLCPWVWTFMPELRFIGASFTETLAYDHSGKSRQVVTSPLYKALFPHIQIKKDTDSKGHWANTLGGDRYARAIGGSIVGVHAHIIVIDDPLDPQGARSTADIIRASEWMTETIPSRKVNKDVSWTALVMQRLSVEDPTALYVGRPDVKHICLPGVLTDYVSPPELKEKYVDGLFDPVRLNKEALWKMEQDLGQFGYAGQFMQSPIPLGGGMFKADRLEVREIAPPDAEFVKIVRGWDKACLLGDTLVTTATGKKRIDAIVPGEKVMTRQGWQTVEAAWLSKHTDAIVSVVCSNGSVVSGTGDHPVFTYNRGWVELGALQPTDSLAAENTTCQEAASIPISKKSSSMAGLTPASQERGISTATRAYPEVTGNTEHCIATSGSTITGEAYPMAIISTTSTATGTTTIQRTWNASQLKSISGVTQILTNQELHSLIQSTTQKHLRAFGNGIPNTRTIQKSKHDGEPPQLRHSTANVNAKLRVPYAMSYSRLKSKIANDAISAQNTNYRLQAKIHKVNHISPLSANRCVPVYDLTIAQAHEFLADGILVHNCTKNGGDYTVGVKMGLHKDGSFWILDIVRGQWSTDEREEIILKTAHRDGRRVRIHIEQEPGSSGKDSAKATVRRLAGFLVTAEPSTGKKEIRADTFSVQVNAGNVKIVKGHYVDAYKTEMTFFPNGRNDDQIDASSLAFSALAMQKPKLGVFK